jgi:hypothetical protein
MIYGDTSPSCEWWRAKTATISIPGPKSPAHRQEFDDGQLRADGTRRQARPPACSARQHTASGSIVPPDVTLTR